MQHLPYLFNMYMEGYPGQKWLLAVLLEAKVIPLRVSILVKYNVSNIFSAMTIILVSSELRSKELQLIQVLKKSLQFS